MPKYPRTFLPFAIAVCTGVLALSAARADSPDQRAAYDRIKSLAGTWTGHMEDPLAGAPVTVRYEIASAGRAVVEFQESGQGFESVTVYYLADGKLHATLYSAAANQPAYRLGKDSTADLLWLEFDGGTGVNPAQDGHVHQGEIRFISPDRIEQRWFHYVGPKEQGVTHWFLDREISKPAMPSEPAAPETPPAPTA